MNLEKRGLRGLAIAESHTVHTPRSILAGVVMRRDGIIDGFVLGGATLRGDDATDEILTIYDRLGRCDIGYLLISGLVISMYNMVDVERIHGELGVPVIGVTYRDSEGIRDSIRRHFQDPGAKLKAYDMLGPRTRIRLHTSHYIYTRSAGCTIKEVKLLLDSITIQGSIPEPLRVARLLARTMTASGCRLSPVNI